MSALFLRRLKQGVLQFVFIKPFTAVLAIILDWQGCYTEGQFNLRSGYAYISLLNNLSVTVSLYSLGLFYQATQDRLSTGTLSKFLCIKAILFFSYWQSCLFTILIHLEYLANDVIFVNEA